MSDDDFEEQERRRRSRRILAAVEMVYGENDARYREALAIGPLALLQLRADWLLRHAEMGEIKITAAEREELERIVASPGDDSWWLGSTFDDRLDELASAR
jgi:hypothetical protein